MKISDLTPYIHDKVKIYVVDSDKLDTIYHGIIECAPDDILKCNVRTISTSRGVIDIGVKYEEDR